MWIIIGKFKTKLGKLLRMEARSRWRANGLSKTTLFYNIILNYTYYIIGIILYKTAQLYLLLAVLDKNKV